MRLIRNVLIFIFVCAFFTSQLHADEQKPSFAKFAYFIDKLDFPVKNVGRIWATPHSVYEGPFRTNDTLSIYLPPHYLEEGRLPFFRGPVETSGPSIHYYDEYAPTESQLQNIFQSDVKTGVPMIPFPEHASIVTKNGALGGQTMDVVKREDIALPHDEKNHLIGGIVVKGDLADLQMDASDRKVFRMVFFKSKRRAYVVEIENMQTRLIMPDSKVVVYDGVPNGAIYVDGDVGTENTRYGSGVHGKVHGRWTVGANGDIYISDNIFYDDTPKGISPAGQDVLALVGRNVFINRETPELLFLYANVFAGVREGKANIGSLFVLTSNDSAHNGQLFWFGNYSGAYPAIMGRFDRKTGQSTNGYDLHKFYDARLASDPPPFFPRIGE